MEEFHLLPNYHYVKLNKKYERRMFRNKLSNSTVMSPKFVREVKCMYLLLVPQCNIYLYEIVN